jgi:hypothetical protein
MADDFSEKLHKTGNITQPLQKAQLANGKLCL